MDAKLCINDKDLASTIVKRQKASPNGPQSYSKLREKKSKGIKLKRENEWFKLFLPMNICFQKILPNFQLEVSTQDRFSVTMNHLVCLLGGGVGEGQVCIPRSNPRDIFMLCYVTG